MKRSAMAPAAPVMWRDDSGLYVAGKRFTLGEVARGSGVSRPQITRVFNGRRGMSLNVAQRIAGFLGVPIETLLGFLRSTT